jgi:hypothetical protein
MSHIKNRNPQMVGFRFWVAGLRLGYVGPRTKRNPGQPGLRFSVTYS